MESVKPEILHICVVGFHHKKGCLLEFSYPPLETLPEAWKTLPSLAMPDGAHNFDHDVVYFHLNSLSPSLRTIFGVSCFQQIPLEKVKNKTADMTRGAVQKAVCILSTTPVYGYIQVKMELITSAFFDGGDFSKTSLLVDAFNNLNACLPDSASQHLYDGISAKDLLLRFRHGSLLLFKLLLLERKVVFFHSPVQPLCTTILSLLSLHPGLIEYGLYEAAFVSSSNAGSPVSIVPSTSQRLENTLDSQQSLKTENTHSGVDVIGRPFLNSGIPSDGAISNPGVGPEQLMGDFGNEAATGDILVEDGIRISSCEDAVDAMLIDDYFGADLEQNRNEPLADGKTESTSPSYDISAVDNLDIKYCGLPLKLFSKGNLCFPYLSISYLDFLGSPGVRGFVAGATNVLFKQKKELSDVIIEIETAKVETQCPELKRQLSLTTEDLRFIEQLRRGILEPAVGRDDEEWIRAHFKIYLMSLLRTSLLQDGSRELDNFNPQFVAAWKNTHNYKMWFGVDHDGIMEINPGHPGAGSLSVQDVRLRFSQVMMSSESGRKLNQAVATTGRAVGGAITQAKGVLSGWWNNFTAQDGKPVVKSIENI